MHAGETMHCQPCYNTDYNMTVVKSIEPMIILSRNLKS